MSDFDIKRLKNDFWHIFAFSPGIIELLKLGHMIRNWKNTFYFTEFMVKL